MKTNLHNNSALNHLHSVQRGSAKVPKRSGHTNLRPLPLLLMMCFGLAMANPNGPQVIHGKAEIVNQGNVLTITNSNNAIINWQNFSINPDELTRFIQPNANSSVLNRVTGNYSSQILGALQSNGKVFLINPNGVLFGNGARVDVNGLVASSLHLSNSDFLAGKSQFSQVGAAGKVENHGTITTPNGGQVFLIAPNVENTGLINAPNGDVVLAAGKSVQLVDSANPDLHVVVSAPENQAINLGQIISHGGRIGIYGALVNQRGKLNANSAVVGQNGKIILKASQDAVLESGSSTTVTSVGEGGTINVLGKRVIANGTAMVDASGALHGGTILLGGDFQGNNPNVTNAEQSFIGKGVNLVADATQAGDGGKVIVWSDKLTEAYGTISARGAGAQGNGGFAEVSGKAKLDFHGKANLSAGVAPAGVTATGKIGTLLLDPAILEIVGGSFDSTTDGKNTFQGGSTIGKIEVVDSLSKIYQSELEGITSSIHLEAGEKIFTSGTFTDSKVILQDNVSLTMSTRNGGGDTGAAHGIDLTSSANLSNLEFIAKGSGSITLTSGTGNYHLADITVGKLTTGGGPVFINARGNVNVTGAIQSNHGSLTVYSKNLNLSNTADLNSGTGVIDLQAKASNSNFIMAEGAKITASSSASPSIEVVKLKADNFTLPSTGITVTGSGAVRIEPYDGSRDLYIIGTKTGNSLELYPSELAGITAPIVTLNTPANLVVDAATNLSNVGGIVMLGNNLAINQALTVTPAHGQISVNAGHAIDFGSGGSLQTNGNKGNVTLRMEELNITGSANAINAGAGSVVLGTHHTSTQINVGNGATSSAGYLGISDSTLRKIATSSVLQVGEIADVEYPWTGSLHVVGDLDLTSNSGLTGGLGLVAANNLNLAGQVKAPYALALGAGGMLSTVSGGSVNAPSITLRANRMDLQSGQGSIDVGSNGFISVRPNTDAWKVNVGGTNGSDSISNTLELSDTELKTFAGSGTLRVGIVDPDDIFSGDLQVVGPIAPSFSGVLSLRSGGNIAQNPSATITSDYLALKSTGHVDLEEANVVKYISGVAGTPQSQNKNLKFTSAVSLAVKMQDGMNGITATGDGAPYNAQAPDAWVRLRSGGALTQFSGALIGGKALYAEGTRVELPENNFLGIIAGQTTGTDAADVFKFGSAANILVATVGGFDGIQQIGPSTPSAVKLVSTGGLVSQSSTGKIVTAGGLKVESEGPVGLAIASGNQVGAIGIDANGPVAFHNLTGNLVVGTGDLGVISNGHHVDIAAHSGNLQIARDINAGAGDLTLSGENVTLGLGASGVNILGDDIVIFANATGGTLSTAGAAPMVGSAASNSIRIRTDNLSFGQFKPTFTANSQAGNIKVSNKSQNVPFALGSNAGAYWIANSVNFGEIDSETSALTTNLSIGTPLTVSNKLGLFATGNISQSAVINAPSAAFYAGTGSIILNSKNVIGNVAAQSSGEFSLTNSVPLTIGQFSRSPLNINGIATNNSSITIDNTGVINIEHPLNSGSGAISVVAHSPLNVHSSVTSTTGNITLEASSSGSTSDNLTISGNGSVSTTGTILLRAGNAISDNLSGNNVVRQAFLNPPILPSLSQCIANPALSGCSSVLPSLNDCVSTPTLNGCSVVLPTLTSCLATPSLPGCSVVLPNLAACIATPTLPGCSVTLPNLTACIATPTLPGCEVVLPNITACIATPTLPGCSVTLPNLTACIATPTLPGCEVILPNITACIATPTLPGCSVTLPNLTACMATPTLPGCQVVLPNLTACIATPTLPGCSVTLPNLTACIATPTLPGCQVVLPNITACIATPTLPGCSVTLPNLTACIATPTLPGCSVTLPNLTACMATPTLPGCQVVLPNITACIATPTLPGCSVTLPNLTACIATPTLPGCQVVLPNLTACIATPTLPGCSVTLPNLTACLATPTLPGCQVTLPNLTACIATPTLPGCSVTLPNLTACLATPTLPGCQVVLPNLTACIATPTLPGCSVTLPNLTACLATPTLPGCEVTLPNITACIATPTLPGCSVTLPNLTACLATPTLPGCQVVLPNLTACIATPTLPGCSVTLPNLTACIATPTLPGCQVVLPNLTACIATPTLPGCSVTLPNLTACIATPTLPGCSVTLPNLTACLATPTLPGCQVVLPNLTACIATPTLPGCSVTLPNLTACIATPTLPGCSVVLPNITACIATPTLPGCSVTLPNLTACIATPTLPGCSAVLPSLTTCISSPSVPACTAVLPSLAACTSNPSLTGCVVVLPPTQTSNSDAPLEKALDSTVSIINSTSNTSGKTTQAPTIFASLTQVAKPEAKVDSTAKALAPSNAEPIKSSDAKLSEAKTDPKADPKGDAKTSDAKTSEAKKDESSKEETKKEEPKKEEVSSNKDSGAKKDEPVKKLYCN